MAQISVKNLTKIFKIPKNTQELSWIKQKLHYFYREWQDKIAVSDISFDIKKGEIVGYIGPNGAGKSTTIKMLTGILTPSDGTIKIMGFHPQDDRIKYTKNIGVVFGQRSNLEYHIPLKDSYNIFRAIYDIPKDEFNKRLLYLTEFMGITQLMSVPVRKLSLGERMRAELVAAFLHKPKIVFLDEPTIGLDIVAKHKIRDFLKEINKKEKVTIILTTHDMGDIEELADRIILIDLGKKMYDGTLSDFKNKYSNWKSIKIVFNKSARNLIKFLDKSGFEHFIENGNKISIKVPSDINIQDFLKSLIDNVEILDLSIEDPMLEKVVKEVYDINTLNNEF